MRIQQGEIKGRKNVARIPENIECAARPGLWNALEAGQRKIQGRGDGVRRECGVENALGNQAGVETIETFALVIIDGHSEQFGNARITEEPFDPLAAGLVGTAVVDIERRLGFR